MFSDPDHSVFDEILDIICFYAKLNEPINSLELGEKAYSYIICNLDPLVLRDFWHNKTLFGLKIKKSNEPSWSIRAFKEDVAIVD